MRKFKVIQIIICCLSFLIAVDTAVFFVLPLRLLYPEADETGQELPEIAAILFNDFNSDHTGINTETRRRVNHGLFLLSNAGLKKLIVVGGNRKKSKRKGAQLMADYLIAEGVPAEKILVEASSQDSISNLEQLQLILSGYDTDTVGLISSPYHLLRIRAMDVPLNVAVRYLAYTPLNCSPPLSRREVWYSAHYNGLAYLAHILLPGALYGKLVHWIRNTLDL